MTIFTCEKCKALLSIDVRLAPGDTVECPHCQHKTEATMIEKYGVNEVKEVEEDDKKEKTATPRTHCINCGAALTPDTNVAHCPVCGTKPFEVVPKKSDVEPKDP